MGVNLGDGTPKALRVHLEQLAKHPPIVESVAEPPQITQDETAL